MTVLSVSEHRNIQRLGYTVTLFRMLFVTFISLIFLTPDVCNSDVKGFPVFERSSYVLFT